MVAHSVRSVVVVVAVPRLPYSCPLQRTWTQAELSASWPLPSFHVWSYAASRKNVLRPQVLHQQNRVPRTNTVCRHHHHHHMQLSPTCNQAHSSSVDRLQMLQPPFRPRRPDREPPDDPTVDDHDLPQTCLVRCATHLGRWPTATLRTRPQPNKKLDAVDSTRQDTIHARVAQGPAPKSGEEDRREKWTTPGRGASAFITEWYGVRISSSFKVSLKKTSANR